MVDDKPSNMFLWVVLMIAGAVLGRIAGSHIGGDAWITVCGWIGFAIAIIGGLVWLHEFDKQNQGR